MVGPAGTDDFVRLLGSIVGALGALATVIFVLEPFFF
jgi:hypothetical protein